MMNPLTQVADSKSLKFNDDQMRLITDTVAKGATPDELKLFLYRCTNMGLDPLKPGQVHFVKYGTGAGSIVIGIEGFRSIAGRTGKLSGVKRGVIKNEKGKLTYAWAEVYRSDWKEPAREEVPFDEYNTGRGPWQKMPETMLKKVAECAALRMAFPDSLGGVYESSEMDQAELQHASSAQAHGLPRVTVDQPTESDGQIDYSYRITFGKYKARSLEEVGPNDLRSYVDYLQSKAAKDGQMIKGQVAEFIERASEYIADFENSPIEK